MELVVERVVEKLSPVLEKKLQSMTDKRFSKVDKALGLSELEEMGVQIPDHIKTEMRLRNLEQQSQPVQQPSRGSGAPQDSDAVSQVIKDAGLDANQPEVISLLSGQYRNLDHFQAEAYKLKVRLANRPTSRTPDSAPAAQGGTGGVEKSVESITSEYTEKMRKLGPGHAAEFRALKEEYRKKGALVDSVTVL